MTYVVDVGYKSMRYPLYDGVIDAACRDGQWLGSGMGWGVRDNQYEFENKEDADTAKRMITGCIPVEYCSVYAAS